MGDIRPTAKWANRMLRPLTSIYHRLEKHQENLSILADAKSLKERTETSTNTSRSSSKAAYSGAGSGGEDRCGSYSDGEQDDPVWVPGRPEKRRLRHNYSSRGQRNRGHRRRSRLSIQSPEVQRTLPGAIEIATPLITGKKTRGLSEGSYARRRLFRDVSLPLTDGSEVDDGRKTVRTSWGSRCYTPYNGSWKEALDRSGNPGLADIARLLDRLFLKFLHNTGEHASPPQQQQRGARSLLSMAVRRLPEFIAEEQDIQDEADEHGDEDMCDAYFTELEAHYAPSGNGWQPLREAVRAQGIYLVSEMLQKRCVTKLIACRLLEECMNHHEYDAFELLLSKFLCTLDNTYDYPTAFDSLLQSSYRNDPVQLLGTYYSRFPCRRSFVFRELAKLLTRQLLSPEWMVTTQWKRSVDMAIQSLSTEGDDSAAATRLIEAVVLSAGSVYPAMDDMGATRLRSVDAFCPRERDTHATEVPRDQSPCPVPIQDALSNLTLSLVTALCGMHLARSHDRTAAEGREVVGMQVRTIMGYLALTVERETEMRPSHEAELPTFHSLRRGCVLLGDCLLQCGEMHSSETDYYIQEPSNIESFYVSVASRQDVIKELAVLARQVFRCCERVHRGHDQPGTSSEVRTKVVQLVECRSQRSLSTFLGKVAAETAMQLAETTVDPDDHVWAVEIQERVVAHQQQPPSGTVLAHDQRDDFDDSPGLYRWEESIEEWVARTPVTKSKFKPVDQQVKPVGVSCLKSPSSCSSSSGVSASPASSAYGASSVTSSAPSLPVKRAFSGRQGQTTRAPKRLRSRRSWGGSESESESDCENRGNQSRAIPTSPATPGASDDDHDDGQERRPHTRSQVQMQTQGPNMTERAKRCDSHEPVAGRRSSQIAVVISTKKPEPPGLLSMLPSPPRTRGLSRRTSKDDRMLAVDPRRRPGGCSISGSTKTRMFIPRVEDEDSGSDDELSL